TFTLNSQAPRSMSAIDSSNEPDGNAEHACPFPATASASRTGASISSVTTGPPSPGTAATPVSSSAPPTTSRVWANARLVLDAPDAAIHGPVWAAVDAPGPELPADAATNTPALVASRKARSTGSCQGLSEPEIEKLITSTPSVTA